MNVKELEREAIRAHAAGERWESFWRRIRDDVERAEPVDRHAYHRLVQRLLGLLVSGDISGAEPIGDGWPRPCPWEVDDEEGACPCPPSEGPSHASP